MKKPIAVATAAATLLLVAACSTSTTMTSTSASASASTPAAAGTGPMSFFITGTPIGRGGDLGGLAGADAHCQRLATAAGHGAKTWRAYLSTQAVAGASGQPWTPGTHARDRIGKGPWYNAKGVLIARDVNHLHNGNNISKETALDERGNPIKGRGEQPNEHDILTGSRSDGTSFAPQTDTTCKAWTSSTEGSAVVGHHDRVGPTQESWARSWNYAHQTTGCTQQALISTGGAGRFYCFAAN